MGKPRLIIIVRHAQSEGNRDKTIHQNTPDHRVGLTSEGKDQAKEAGEKLRSLLREDDTLHFFISPYKRTRQTTEGILSTLCSNDPVPSPFQRHHIKVYEEPRLREQDFGNFQPGTEEVERLWRERANYGHFFYRIPNGESGADVYDRVSSFNASLFRRFKEDQMASVAVLVTHGLCSRVFLMAWYHYSVEFFEDLRNIDHCEFLVMKLGKNGRYVLQNQLRRWTDLKRERASQRRSISAQSPPKHIPVRRWATEAGDEHQNARNRPHRQNTADLFRDDDEPQSHLQPQPQHPEKSDLPGPSTLRQSESVEDEPARGTDDNTNRLSTSQIITNKTQSALTASLQNIAVSSPSPKARPSYKAYLGRDGGGTRSGSASPFDMSDEDDEVDPADNYNDINTPRATDQTALSNVTTAEPVAIPVAIDGAKKSTSSLSLALRGELDMDRPGRVFADALGDHSEPEIDQADEELGTRDRQRREMARIVAQEVRERTHHGDVY